MREWRKIQSDIYDALSNYDVDVDYTPKRGRGWSSECSYFTVTIHEDWDSDDIENDLADVCEEWDLDFDYDSYGSFDLNADWDRND